MKMLENYQNREQTYVKHRLLRAYLERLFMIIGQHQGLIRYVDCFSGPWNETEENLGDTSIGISMEIMVKCREGLRKMGKDVKFQALFIEKDRHAFQRLETHLATCLAEGVTADARNGEFFELRQQILDWCGPNDFTFFFIDPKGWKKVVELHTLEPLLKRPNSEFLINFMYDFLLRTHPQAAFQEDMQAIFGELPDTTNMEPEQKETFLVKLYRSRLKRIAPQRGGLPRTAHVPILYPLKDRTLYHLVYLTRHAKGICVFMAESEKLQFVQRRVREHAKQANREKRSSQLELFQSSDLIQTERRTSFREVKDYWLSRLSANAQQFGIDQLAEMIEETGWFESDLQVSFGELASQGIVANLDDHTHRRRRKFVHFDAEHNKGEHLIRLKP